MISGTASVDELARGAAIISEFSSDEVVLTDVECFQLTAEMRNQAREAVLPPGLHPTVPPALSLQAWNVGSSPWGAFSMATVRITCRSGARARGFMVGAVVTTQAAVDGLRSNFGFPARLGDVRFRRSYDGVDLEVDLDGTTIATATGLDPDPMAANDVQYTGSLTLAETPLGCRLVQVEARHDTTREERLTSRLLSFDGAGWGQPLLDPYYVVASSVTVAEVSMPAVRFVCDPEKYAWDGTESVS
ncbi:MAG: acetoacetate decarboxylase family protein [Actinomycetota bacterium]|jgi:hypothetical protein|nr:acetoacetate decarboxylase family protein [Actinomycetota bacterium]